MKTIATINHSLPSVEDSLSYHSGASLVDFDIVVFNPEFPNFRTENFSSGGYCVSIESSKRILESMRHWKQEINSALERGSTVFVILNKVETENFATSSSSERKGQITYHTTLTSNYGALPEGLEVRNAKGKKISTSSALLKPLLGTLEELIEYQVILHKPSLKASFNARDGSQLGGIAKVNDLPGYLVLLPYFSFQDLKFFKADKWSPEAIKRSKAIEHQLAEIDKAAKSLSADLPMPEWVAEFELPGAADVVAQKILDLNTKIDALNKQVTQSRKKLREYESFRTLLYGTGKPLEDVIEKSFKLLGYEVENFRVGSLEIDHIIKSPNGLRMIGEAEGKDSSAIAIAKFRQLENNINEDFQRDDVTEPAKGVLFGNPYRLIHPNDRGSPFTEKCLVNAKRLGTALINCADLYPVVCHILDNPEDDNFKRQCRDVIEATTGGLVNFPKTLD